LLFNILETVFVVGVVGFAMYLLYTYKSALTEPNPAKKKIKLLSFILLLFKILKT